MPSKPKPPAGSNSDTSKEATPKPKAPRSKATPHVKPKPQPRAAKGKENEEKPKKKFELPGQTRDTPEEVRFEGSHDAVEETVRGSVWGREREQEGWPNRSCNRWEVKHDLEG